MTVKYIVSCAYRGALVGAGFTMACHILASGQNGYACRNNPYYHQRGWASEYDQQCLNERKKALFLMYACFTTIGCGIGFVYGTLRAIDCWLSDSTVYPRMRA